MNAKTPLLMHYTTPTEYKRHCPKHGSVHSLQSNPSFLLYRLLIREYFGQTTMNMQIPETQIAAVLPPTGASPTAQLQISTTRPVPTPGQGEILVKLEYSGVCHSDVHSVHGETPMLTDIAGHEGIGKVVQGRYFYPDISKMLILIRSYSTVGSGLDEMKWVGERVGIR